MPRTRLIGRESERDAARSFLLDGAVPLLTLTGPGGVGKTRLALAVAHEVAASFGDGVAWVDLAVLTAPAELPDAVAAALGLASPHDLSVEQLGHALHANQTLLLLDNCEHLVAAAADLAGTLLATCPALQVLATSRAPFRLLGEQRLPIEPLPLPRTDGLTKVELSPAVQLFAERARSVHPAFALNEANAAVVAELCRQLDGLPLALELAAARSTVLDPEALLTQMTDRLHVLDHGARNLPPRQQTIEATIAWSYDLLDADAQALFRGLAVFVGGFGLEAAAAVTSRDGHSPRDVLTTLESLVAQSLVGRLDSTGEPRFAMLETIRAYALERLQQAGERDTAQDAHAAYFVACAERSLAQRPGARGHDDFWIQWAKVEQANIRAALARLTDVGDADGVLLLSGTFVWFVQTNPQEGGAWLEWALAQTPRTATGPRARALAELAFHHWSQGRFAEAIPMAEASLAMGEHLHDPEVMANALHFLGLIALSQQLYERAQPLLTQALAIWRECGERVQEAEALQLLAGAEHGLGQSDDAMHHASEALTLYRDIGYAVGLASGLNRVGRIARDQGDERAAAEAYQEAIQLCEDVGNRFHLAGALSGVAELATSHGQAEIGAALIGFIDALAQEAGTARLPTVGVTYDRATTAALAALGADRFADLRYAGQRLHQDDAIALAGMVTVPATFRGVPDSSSAQSAGGRAARETGAIERVEEGSRDLLSAITARAPITTQTIDLTWREQEVLALLGQRRTDREIAAVLFISRKTASSHVSSILAKLGAANRRDAAALAARRGML